MQDNKDKAASMDEAQSKREYKKIPVLSRYSAPI